MLKRLSVTWLILGAIGVLSWAAGPAKAQSNGDLIKSLERQMRQYDEVSRQKVSANQPISERLLIDYGGSVRFGFLSVDDEQGHARILRQSDALLYVLAELDGAHRFYGQLRFLYNDFNDGDSFTGDGDEFEDPIADRYWYQFDLRGLHQAQTGEWSDANVNVKVGRQFVQWGAGLALSDVLYAGVFDFELADFGFVGLVGLTPDDDTVDFNASRPEFDENTRRAYYGGMFEYRGLAEHRPYVSFLAQRDHNDNNDVFAPTTRFGYDSEYIGVGSQGAIGPVITYRAELMHESGSTYSDPTRGTPQTRDKVDAWAGVLTLIYALRDANDTRTEFELLGASGDGDRIDGSDTIGGNLTGTDDNAFNSLGYVNTGLALSPDLPNLLMLRFGASTSPAVSLLDNDWLRVGVNGFLFFKTDANAAMSIATDDNKFVGGEVDLLLDYRITSDVTASLRYGVFFPGAAIPETQDNIRQFFYAGVSYAF